MLLFVSVTENTSTSSQNAEKLKAAKRVGMMMWKQIWTNSTVWQTSTVKSLHWIYSMTSYPIKTEADWGTVLTVDIKKISQRESCIFLKKLSGSLCCRGGRCYDEAPADQSSWDSPSHVLLSVKQNSNLLLETMSGPQAQDPWCQTARVEIQRVDAAAHEPRLKRRRQVVQHLLAEPVSLSGCEVSLPVVVPSV